MKRKAIFIDKDGTLIYNVPYNIDPKKIRLYDGAGKSLRQLKEHGFLLIVVSNQSGVAMGYFDERELSIVEKKIQHDLLPDRVALDAIFYCPHHPNGKIPGYAQDCRCRKPMPGLLFSASAKFDIDLSQSWMIGDILNDVEAGNRAGCQTVLINNGNETEWRVNIDRLPSKIVSNINDAANLILNT